jgi:ribosomal protein S17E
MGRIKSKLVKRTTHMLMKDDNKFTDKFEDNKKLIEGIDTSKKIKNQIAGYITRVKKAELQLKKKQ